MKHEINRPTVIDSIEINGLQSITEIEYKGNFTVNYRSKEQLTLLREFFGVRGSKFDMRLLEKRQSLASAMGGFKYA